MTEPKVYLSHGGGVNSWALYLYLIEQGEVPGVDFEAVFVDHGADWPHTYSYMQMMQEKGYPITVIRPEVEGFTTLWDACVKWRKIPDRSLRWCTDKFKVRQLDRYFSTPCVTMLGIDAGESHRARTHERNGQTVDYPLVEAGIDRDGCAEIIKRHGLPVPGKSGCWFCSFQTRTGWIRLQEEHPDLFCRALSLEQLCNDRRVAAGKEPVYFRDIPLDILVRPKDSRGRRATKGQLAFPELERPCSCGL